MKSILTGVISAAVLLGAISDVPYVEAAQSGQSARYPKCASGAGYNCVVDGDTLWINGQKVRVAEGLSQIFPLNPMLTIRREFAAPKVAERTDDSECHCRKAEAPVEA